MKTENAKRSGLSARQNILFTSFVIVFFLSVTIVYYAMLYSQTRRNITQSSELNAVSSADQIDKYLSTGVDIIKMTGYTLDNMMTEEHSSAEMLDYIVNQTVATYNIVSGQTNGIYAYINGEYLDGVGWVPDEDYVPTERPWYIDAVAGAGKVVVVDPYVDAQTGTTMVTLARLLNDGKSVVAVDFSMEDLQSITERIANEGDSEMEIVLDGDCRVISHSDRNEVGKNYKDDDGSFGHAIAAQLGDQMPQNKYFQIKYDGKVYMVYAMPVENDWICISVTNATAAFGRLRITLIITVAAAAIILAMLLFVMNRSNRKEVLAEQMKQLADQQTEFAYCDPMTGLKNRRAYAEDLEQLSEKTPDICCVVMLDVNGLKTVNDTHGHEAGDELIIAAADSIRASFAEVEAIYRIGGDEFCVIAEDTEETVIRCLKDLEQRTAEWKGSCISGFSVSYGVGTDREESVIDSIVKLADHRMYENKSRYYSMAGHDRRHSDRC